METIVEIAKEAGQFNTLLTAATAAGLAETLSNDGPFTVFAPTDDAFNALPEGTIEALLKDTEKLKSILLYHVVAGKYKAKDVVSKDEIKTVQGQSVRIDASDGVKINDAHVIKADVEAENGVIHIIDKVILPN
ncbi:MAG: fasciclin domain-containing protein [Candidatus Thorarchaeota archaeon]